MPSQREAIGSVAALRPLYPSPKDRAVKERLDRLDLHCRRFIALSPFVVIASGSSTGGFDASREGHRPDGPAETQEAMVARYQSDL